MASVDVTTPTLATQEVRVALTMTGGVSLAVWMGGVAREIDRLARASDARNSPAGVPGELDKYARLLSFLDLTVDVDVMSGTSAGGVNSALLAYARTRGGTLEPLRDLWLDVGALLDLLREPTDSDIPSLLHGDGFMLSQLHDKLPGLGSATKRSERSTTLYITTTLLTGEASRFTDAMGTLVQDTDHHGIFMFTEKDLAKDGIEAALALAARSTASFPGAFEPSYIPYDTTIPARGKVPVRPPMAEYANITRSHWAADGGLLDNQPLDLVLERVFDRPAERPVRRVMLYVVPTSGPQPDPTVPTPGDDVNSPLGLIDALLKDLGAATSQSIAADLRAIVTHNERTAARRKLRLQLAELAVRFDGASDRGLITESLVDDYRERASQQEAQRLVSALFRVLSTWGAASAGRPGLPPEWVAEIGPGGPGEITATLECARAIRAAPAERPLLDKTKAIVLDVLRQAYAVGDKDAVGALIGPVHRAGGPAERVDPLDFARTTVLTALAQDRVPDLPAFAADLGRRWTAGQRVDETTWIGLGTSLTRGAATLVTASRADPRTAEGKQARADLATYVSYLRLDDQLLVGQVVANRLRGLAMAEEAMTSPDAGPDQHVDLVQLSADTRSLLSPRIATAQDKLTGLQFHHFGAFYKKSWRANDWMWGRLDATGWLVHLLLQPERLRAIADDRKITRDRAKWARDELARFGPDPLPEGGDETDEQPSETSVLAELAFLDDPTVDPPRGLPRTALWLASAWQREIAAVEVRSLAETIYSPSGDKLDRSPGASVSWAKDVLASTDPAELLDKCPVPRETFASDMGTPLMVKTLTKAAATATGAVGSVRQLPGPVKPAVGTARTLALSSYRVASATGGVARSVILIGLGLLVVGFALASQSSDFLGVSGLSAAGLGAVLVTFGAWQFSRALVAALAAVVVTGAIASLAIPAERRWLFSTTTKPQGVVTREMAWFASDWWHPLAAVGVLAVIITVLAAFFAGIGRSRKLKAQKPKGPLSAAGGTAVRAGNPDDPQ